MIEKAIYIGFDTMKDLYYLWDKGTRKGVQYNTYYTENNGWLPNIIWETDRHYGQFYTAVDALHLVLKMKYNGQSKSEFQKNYKRVKDIVTKSAGDKDKAIALSKTQANRITDEWKAINRAMAARELNEEDIFEVFFQRAYELGSVTKQDYRDYQLEKLGI